MRYETTLRIGACYRHIALGFVPTIGLYLTVDSVTMSLRSVHYRTDLGRVTAHAIFHRAGESLAIDKDEIERLLLQHGWQKTEAGKEPEPPRPEPEVRAELTEAAASAADARNTLGRDLYTILELWEADRTVQDHLGANLLRAMAKVRLLFPGVDTWPK